MQSLKSNEKISDFSQSIGEKIFDNNFLKNKTLKSTTSDGFSLIFKIGFLAVLCLESHLLNF